MNYCLIFCTIIFSLSCLLSNDIALSSYYERKTAWAVALYGEHLIKTALQEEDEVDIYDTFSHISLLVQLNTLMHKQMNPLLHRYRTYLVYAYLPHAVNVMRFYLYTDEPLTQTAYKYFVTLRSNLLVPCKRSSIKGSIKLGSAIINSIIHNCIYFPNKAFLSQFSPAYRTFFINLYKAGILSKNVYFYECIKNYKNDPYIRFFIDLMKIRYPWNERIAAFAYTYQEVQNNNLSEYMNNKEKEDHILFLASQYYSHFSMGMLFLGSFIVATSLLKNKPMACRELLAGTVFLNMMSALLIDFYTGSYTDSIDHHYTALYTHFSSAILKKTDVLLLKYKQMPSVDVAPLTHDTYLHPLPQRSAITSFIISLCEHPKIQHILFRCNRIFLALIDHLQDTFFPFLKSASYHSENNIW